MIENVMGQWCNFQFVNSSEATILYTSNNLILEVQDEHMIRQEDNRRDEGLRGDK